MDMSKLPRMSKTPEPSPAEPAASPAPVVDYAPTPATSVGAEAWFSIGVGVILLLVYPYTAQWLVSLISNYKPPFLPITDSTGKVVPYPQSIFFMAHLSVFAFALVLVLDGLVLLSRRPALVGVALVLTVLAVLLNAYYILSSMGRGEALPILSALAVVFGVYIAIHQWRTLSQMR